MGHLRTLSQRRVETDPPSSFTADVLAPFTAPTCLLPPLLIHPFTFIDSHVTIIAYFYTSIHIISYPWSVRSWPAGIGLHQKLVHKPLHKRLRVTAPGAALHEQ